MVTGEDITCTISQSQPVGYFHTGLLGPFWIQYFLGQVLAVPSFSGWEHISTPFLGCALDDRPDRSVIAYLRRWFHGINISEQMTLEHCIFIRWGEKVFRGNQSLNNGWNSIPFSSCHNTLYPGHVPAAGNVLSNALSPAQSFSEALFSWSVSFSLQISPLVR